jgi:hypothetical protein
MSKSNKITHGDIDFKSKSAELKSYRMDKVMSPYDGVVVKTNNSSDGYLLIQHNIGGSKFYSQFCGVNNTLAHLSDNVRGGSTIGFFSEEPITYSVLSSNLDYLNPKKFLNGELFKDEESKDKSKVSDKKETKPTKRYRDSKDYEINALSPVTLPIEFAANQLLKGADIAGKELKKIGKGMFQLHNKEKDERLKQKKNDSEDNLNEEISRIKNLLK